MSLINVSQSFFHPPQGGADEPLAQPVFSGEEGEFDNGKGSGNDLYCLTQEEWDALEELAMSFHGVMRLIKRSGFDNSTGAQELLSLAYRGLEELMARIRDRLSGESRCSE